MLKIQILSVVLYTNTFKHGDLVYLMLNMYINTK